VPYGHLERTVFASPPRPVFTKAQIDADGADPGSHPGPGAGRAHQNEVVTYRLRPRAIGPSEGANAWLYKDPKRYPPGTRLSGAKYSKYGDAGPWQGTRDEHFAYLCWSWVRQDGLSGAQSLDVDGGGAVRTLLPPDQVVHRCDVDSVTAPAWNRRGDILGRVVAIYVRATIGASDLYGWMVHSHIDFTGHSAVRRLHVVRA
jgi:hypothetical protein